MSRTATRSQHGALERARRLLEATRGAGRLIHPFPTLANVVATLAFAAVAAGPPRPRDALLLAGAMLGAQATIGVTNDLADFDLDRATKPRKPLVRGRVGKTAARWLATGAAVLAATCAATFGIASLALVLAGTALGIWYNVALKRSQWSWLPYVLALPLAPIWVWTALGRFTPALLWLYVVGAPLLLALHIANALADFAADLQAGSFGLVQRLGARRAELVLWFGAAVPLLVLAARALGASLLSPALSATVSVATATYTLALCIRLFAHQPNPFRHIFGVLSVYTIAAGLGWALLGV